MNLYDLHPNPEKAPGYEKRFQIPQLAYEEALKTYIKTHERSPELEPVIARDSLYAYLYAQDVLGHKRFPEGEKAIAKDPRQAYFYAAYVLEKRWPEAEPVIAKERWYADMYNNRFGAKL